MRIDPKNEGCIEILPPNLDIMSASLFWHPVHRTSAERTTSWKSGMDKDSTEARLVPEGDKLFDFDFIDLTASSGSSSFFDQH